MNERDLNRMIDEREAVVEMAFPALMRKVYLWMTLALAITGFTAYLVANSFAFWSFMAEHSWMMIALVVAELALVFTISARINRLSLNTATLLFGAYSVLNGLTLAPIFMAYTQTSITRVFFITAATFAVTAFIGYAPKPVVDGKNTHHGACRTDNSIGSKHLPEEHRLRAHTQLYRRAAVCRTDSVGRAEDKNHARRV